MVHGFYVGHRQIRIDRMNDRGEALVHALGVAGSAHGHGYVRPRTLREGHVDLGEAAVTRAAIADVLVDADDLPVNRRAEIGDAGDELFYGDALRQWVDAGEILRYEGGVHNGDGHAAIGVGFREGASARDADSEGGEVAGRYHVESCAGTLRAVRYRFTDDVEGHAEARAAYWIPCRDRSRRDPGKRLNALNQLPIENADLLGSLQAVSGHGQSKGEDVIGLEAHVDVREVPETVDCQTRGGQQRERQGKLR